MVLKVYPLRGDAGFDLAHSLGKEEHLIGLDLNLVPTGFGWRPARGDHLDRLGEQVRVERFGLGQSLRVGYLFQLLRKGLRKFVIVCVYLSVFDGVDQQVRDRVEQLILERLDLDCCEHCVI